MHPVDCAILRSPSRKNADHGITMAADDLLPILDSFIAVLRNDPTQHQPYLLITYYYPFIHHYDSARPVQLCFGTALQGHWYEVSQHQTRPAHQV
jgi:hypothetical protein